MDRRLFRPGQQAAYQDVLDEEGGRCLARHDPRRGQIGSASGNPAVRLRPYGSPTISTRAASGIPRRSRRRRRPMPGSSRPAARSDRKREWKSGGETKTVWIADYFDQGSKRHTKTFSTKKAADAWLVTTRGEVRSEARVEIRR